MSLGVCIPDLIDQGAIPPERAARVQEWYNRRVSQLREGGLGDTAAQAQATTDTLDWLRADVLHKARETGLRAKMQGDWHADMKMAAADNGVPPIRHVRDRMLDIFRQGEVVASRLLRHNDELIARYRLNFLSFNTKRAELEDVGRALIDQTEGNTPAHVMARAMAETMELARTMFNAAGGRIGKLGGKLGYLPQEHDWRKLADAGYEAWRSHPAIERVKVVHPETGMEAHGVQREEVLARIFETIQTQGAQSRTLGQPAQRSMANRRADPRVLHFDSYDDWMEYHRAFGTSSDIYDIFTQHVRGMARDIALMQTMGPNPAATLRFVQDAYGQMVDKSKDARLKGRLVNHQQSLQHVYDELSGAHMRPANEAFAHAGSAVRAFVVASHLGSATISAIADLGTTLRTAQYNRLPIMRVVWRVVSDIARGENASREALQRGLALQDYIGHTSQMERYTGEEMSAGITRVMADAVIRGSLLARWTRKIGWAWGREHQALLTRNSGKSWDDLNPQIRRIMQDANISRGDWDVYRKTPIRDDGLISDIVPLDVEDMAIGDKFQRMILNETDHAIFTQSYRMRAAVNARLKRGDIFGEPGKMAFTLKNFPLGILAIHGRRMMDQPGITGKAGYVVPLFFYMTALGALSQQLYNLATGRDLDDMTDGDFIMKAIARGGGAPVIADLIGTEGYTTRGALGRYMIGPIYGGADEAIGIANRNALLAAEGKETKFAAEYARLGKKWTPGQNLWQVRLPVERAFQHFIERELDPDAQKRYARMMQRAEDEGGSYWWEPGQPLPRGAPNLEQAMGDQ